MISKKQETRRASRFPADLKFLAFCPLGIFVSFNCLRQGIIFAKMKKYSGKIWLSKIPYTVVQEIEPADAVAGVLSCPFNRKISKGL